MVQTKRQTWALNLAFVFILLNLEACFALYPGINWGTQSSHRLPANIIVSIIKQNNITRVKLFDADPSAMAALRGSDLEVMVGIPNYMLPSLASSSDAADNWVKVNVSAYIVDTNIRYVAVGNEPFLTVYNKAFESVTVPALQNIKSALSRANLQNIKVTVPLNADVLQSSSNLPSTGVFRPEIKPVMLDIMKILDSSNSAFMVNLYPFISLNQDPHFPKSFAFFDGSATTVVDGPNTYTNVFDASYDLLVAALKDAGYPNMPIMVGEIGWPTDGTSEATVANAHKFNHGLLKHVMSNKGTHLRPDHSLDVYLFSLIDEDQKSIEPGTFERHWGIFTYDGQAKYKLHFGPEATILSASGVQYLPSKWCVVKPSSSIDSTLLKNSVDYACANADCTKILPGGSCALLSETEKASYAFNRYFQQTDQRISSCNFQDLATVTTEDPSVNGCTFELQIVSG